MDCTATSEYQSTTMTVIGTGALPGGTCVVEGQIQGDPSNTIAMKVQGIEFASGDDLQYIETAFASPAECGKLVQAGASTMVRFKIALTADAPMASEFPAAADAGVTLVPADEYDPAKCLAWSGGEAVPATS